MKLSTPTSARRQAFTLLEAVVVLGLIVILAGMISPGMGGTKMKASRIKCASNLKQVALAFKVFANDNDGLFPFQLPAVTNAGLDRRAWTQFLVLSNELGSAKILWCPGDKPWRSAATNFGWGAASSPQNLVTMQNNAVSYFIGVGARTNQNNAILLGDCNVAASRSAPLYSSRSGDPFVSVPTTATWSTNSGHHDWAGNYALADGSVQQVTESGLRAQLSRAEKEYDTNVNRFVFPQ